MANSWYTFTTEYYLLYLKLFLNGINKIPKTKGPFFGEVLKMYQMILLLHTKKELKFFKQEHSQSLRFLI